MKIHRAATIALAAASSATAFSVSRSGATTTTFLGQSLARTSSRSLPATAIQRKSIQSTGMTMLLDALFGGGAQEQKIVYDNLDHPGPELAKFAQEGKMPAFSEKNPNLALATFAGGCFWGLELACQRVPGVVYTAVGYAQGKEEFPTYGQVCSGATGHTEAVMVYYDPKECSYDDLLDTFFNRVNPTTVNGQGNDFGTQYRTGVYFHSKEQEEIARKRFEKEQTRYSKPIATELKAATPFWPAEKYHQQYLEKGGRFGMPQDASKGAMDEIRCYG